MRLLGLWLALMWSVAAGGAELLTIQITEGSDNATPVAIVPLGWAGTDKPTTDVAQIVSDDLQRVGLFEPIAREDMLALPTSGSEVVYRDWRAVGAEYVLVGKLSRDPDGRLRAEYELMDVVRQNRLFKKVAVGSDQAIRSLAHTIADNVYRQLTGIPGAFNTRIAYVSSASKSSGKFEYRLMVADADGFGAKAILVSPEPIMSPAWAPDGKRLAYVSFEGRKPAIFIHEIATRRREKVTDFPGLNGAPAWSPDGRKLAMVLSKDGNPDIYVLDLETRKLQQVVSHFAIDTEPGWMADGSGIVFTSDRGGLPQIYHIDLSSRKLERLTFEGDYNARARVLPDGTGFVMIHREAGSFHVALQRFSDGRLWILSQTSMDESPTVAPNGSMVMYATQHRGWQILAAVSVDGGAKYRLPSPSGDVRDPAWSPN